MKPLLLRQRIRSRFPGDRWCSAADFMQEHTCEPVPLAIHVCTWDYCMCWSERCTRCAHVIVHPNGLDEIR